MEDNRYAGHESTVEFFLNSYKGKSFFAINENEKIGEFENFESLEKSLGEEYEALQELRKYSEQIKKIVESALGFTQENLKKRAIIIGNDKEPSNNFSPELKQSFDILGNTSFVWDIVKNAIYIGEVIKQGNPIIFNVDFKNKFSQGDFGKKLIEEKEIVKSVTALEVKTILERGYIFEEKHESGAIILTKKSYPKTLSWKDIFNWSKELFAEGKFKDEYLQKEKYKVPFAYGNDDDTKDNDRYDVVKETEVFHYYNKVKESR